jgi:hypothetical protein
VWKAALASRRINMTPTRIEEARAFCFENEWVGIGWDVNGAPQTPQDYCEAAAARYCNGSWRTAHKLLRRAATNDLVWSQSIRTGYWIGRLTDGPNWQYRDDEPFSDFDLYQVRHCHWENIGTIDNVPTTVRNCFAGSGMTFCRIRAGNILNGEAITEYLSSRAYVDAGGDGLDAPELDIADRPETLCQVLQLIAHDDLEDIVGLYLQQQGWWIVPSTAKRGTANTEFVLRNAAGNTAYVQVKSGNETITQLGFPDDLETFFVFQANGNFMPGQLANAFAENEGRITVINIHEIANWIDENRALLPNGTRALIELVGE